MALSNFRLKPMLLSVSPGSPANVYRAAEKSKVAVGTASRDRESEVKDLALASNSCCPVPVTLLLFELMENRVLV
ncbi:hypothetical protein RAB80_004441 [Fusarium oxysporum f. sp. vasinfectum]|nr:hypothetical protein RAB80_004441 [Fusarium oxysporum f. sp. vasinfectum]KAK2936213.1 hypothetical protein FoTM2_004157 [Fusarium oxysporum f. sp. vasinfectum]